MQGGSGKEPANPCTGWIQRVVEVDWSRRSVKWPVVPCFVNFNHTDPTLSLSLSLSLAFRCCLMDILSVVLAFDIAVPETRLNRKIKLPLLSKGGDRFTYPSLRQFHFDSLIKEILLSLSLSLDIFQYMPLPSIRLSVTRGEIILAVRRKKKEERNGWRNAFDDRNYTAAT